MARMRMRRARSCFARARAFVVDMLALRLPRAASAQCRAFRYARSIARSADARSRVAARGARRVAARAMARCRDTRARSRRQRSCERRTLALQQAPRLLLPPALPAPPSPAVDAAHSYYSPSLRPACYAFRFYANAAAYASLRAHVMTAVLYTRGVRGVV